MSTDTGRGTDVTREVLWRAVPWRVVGVVASVLLNALLIGIVAGHFFTVRRDARPGPLLLGAHIRALPAVERGRFEAVMAGHREAIRAAPMVQHRARDAAKADIGAPALDTDRVRADFAALRQANATLQASVNDGLIEALGTLSAGSRAALVAREKP